MNNDNVNVILQGKEIVKGDILKQVDFSMIEGEMVAIMGPSGSGKSTLLYQLSGLEAPDKGNVYFCGNEVSHLSEDERAKLRLNEMGIVFQQMNMLPDLNIVDNVILTEIERQRKSKEQTEAEIKVKAIKLMDKLGISSLRQRKTTEVSGGELQRAAICRSLMNDPKVIFADEPTGALNNKSTRDVMEIFSMLNREGKSILIVTHDMKVASYCNRVLYMCDGAISGEYSFTNDTNITQNNREESLGNWLKEMNW